MDFEHEPIWPKPVAVELPRDHTCAARARAFVRDQLPEAGPRALERMQLAATELVTNAWKHGAGRIELRLARGGGRLRMEVVDEGTGAVPAIRHGAGNEYGGWGLRIVEGLSQRWGCFEGTTHVWAEFSLAE